MRILGELCLLSAFVGSGFAAFACLMGGRRSHRALRAGGLVAAAASVLALTAVLLVLAWALVEKDFRFAYVAQYSSSLLPWHYSLSALWVGQAGSLLLWAWFSGALALLLRFWPNPQPNRLREPAFGILMACLCFLAAIMVFAADPMKPSISPSQDGAGLSPLLQHPAMLIHPPVVFLGYALWGIPFALAMAALATGRLDTVWVRQARPWALAAWVVSGAGILLGAEWAYEELGWGGYWSWDPVENGSLIPWLTGTALIHTLMTWQYRGAFKKTAVCLAIATFGLCNFATFLTRSGIFSSLHAFSQSSIGWLFLALMIGLGAGGGLLIILRRKALSPDRPIRRVLSREAVVLISIMTLLLITAATVAGTIITAISSILIGKPIMMGPAFYNNVLIPTGLVLLAATATAPLLRWGSAPSPSQKKCLLLSAGVGSVAGMIGWAVGELHAIESAVIGLAVFAAGSLLATMLLDAQRKGAGTPWYRLLRVLRDSRRQYAGFLIHIGFVCLAVGVAGSSLRTHQQKFVIREGESVEWDGRTIRLVRVIQRELPAKLVVEAELEITHGDTRRSTLLPAQHFHFRQQQWTTEVAIQSAWSGDLYAILGSDEDNNEVRLTFIENPMMRWLWLGGCVMGLGALIRRWPARRRIAGVSAVSLPAAQRRVGPKQREMVTAAIQARGLSKDIGNRRILHKIDIEVLAGESVGLTGINGAGKTTLLRCLASVIRPTEGGVCWFGHPAGGKPMTRRLIGMVGHESYLYPHLTLRENLIFAARMCGVSEPMARADQLLRRVALSSRADLLPTQVSRGMQQRVTVARALVHDPQILLLDEPFSGLDAPGSDWLMETLRDLRDGGRTICFATHDKAIAHRLADKIFELRTGRLYPLEPCLDKEKADVLFRASAA